MKLLHSADWHLDSPLVGRSTGQAMLLRKQLLALPQKVVDAARAEGCDIILLSGDLFDGPYTLESFLTLRHALEDAAIPVFIAPGNHDPIGPNSPWVLESWPGNVHIFTRGEMESVALPNLNCRVYGAAFMGPDSPPLLTDFHVDCAETWAVGVLHGDPTQLSSPYNPITQNQVRKSGLSYLALGHIHKAGRFQAGNTLCLWPGSPMGRGFDEPGIRGVQIVTLGDGVDARFLPLDTPRFFDLEANVTGSAEDTVASLLPALGSNNFYRITLTGECSGVDVNALAETFSRFPNLEIRDRTVPPVDLWSAAGTDSLEGVYFQLLKDMLEDPAADPHQVRLAAKLSRQILDGQEAVLP